MWFISIVSLVEDCYTAAVVLVSNCVFSVEQDWHYQGADSGDRGVQTHGQTNKPQSNFASKSLGIV
jgi:hypothetical protein